MQKIISVIFNRMAVSIIAMLILVLWCFIGYTQTPDLKFTALTTKDGLVGNIVNVIVQDDDGIMWLGTPEGMNKYDGKHFTVYSLGRNERSLLGSREISCIYKDKAGTMWVGTIGAGLYYYDRPNDVFKKFTSAIKGQRLSQEVVSSICADEKGKLWTGTVNGLDVVDPVNKTISHVRVGSGHKGEIPVGAILCVFKDDKQRMWVGTMAGLYMFDTPHNSFIHLRHNNGDGRSLASDGVTTIAQDKARHIWVGTANGLSRLMDDETHFTNYKYNDQHGHSLSGDIVYSIAADDKDHIWIGTEGGLDVMDVNTGRSVTYKHDRRNPYSLNSKSIRSIYIDPKGIYWVGTYMGGLNKYDKNLTLFNYIQSSELDPHGLNSPLVSSFAQKSDHEMYVATDGGGLNIFNERTSLFEHVDIRPREKINSAGLPILSMQMDSKQQLWIGTFGHGLFRLNTTNNNYVQYTSGNGKNNISQNNIFCLKEDRGGKIWIGTNGFGVNVFDPKIDAFRKFLPGYIPGSDNEVPLNGFIRAIEEDADGNIWIGSYGTGIAVYHQGTGSFKVFNPANTGFPITNIISLLKDANGNMWIGTSGDGIFFYNGKLKKFSAFKNNGQLPNGVICKLLQDKAGQIWFSTNRGICRIDPLSQKLSVYSRYNGLQNNVFLNGAGIINSNGTIYFGGVDGFNYFQPVDVKLNTNPPPVILTALDVDSKRLAPAHGNPEPVNIGKMRQVTIKYKQDFAISFVALNYTLPQQNKYAYILEGFDRSWKYAGIAGVANYTNIDPGVYTFRVKACNNDGIWNETGTALQIIVKPPFWMTIYAYLFYMLVIVAALLFIRRQGVKKLRNKLRDEQDLKEAEARHELDRMKIKFLTNLSHEFRTPISLIMAPVDKLIAQQHGQPVAEQLGVIKKNARRLLNLVNQLLDFRKLEENELKLNVAEGELISFVREMTDSFHDLAEGKQIKTSFKTAEEKMFVKFDFDKVERIMFNLLSNAFKFTLPGGEIAVEILNPVLDPQQNSYVVTLMVRDTGMGIAAAQLNHIFERFYQVDTPSGVLNQGSGIGLSITRELVQLHGGDITAESTPGEGSVFTFTINVEAIALPVEIAPVLIAGPEEEDTCRKIASPVLNGMNLPHVLIVEDNSEMRQYLADSLGASYKISEAANGREGWHKALALHPDLVVSDISMPYMDGIELSRKLKSDKRTSHIPIILLTAMASQQDQLAGLELGVSDYLTKPFHFEILNIKIKNLLHVNETLKETYQKKIRVMPNDLDVESSAERFIKDVVIYIEQNIHNPKFSVEETSHHFNMSRGSFYSKIIEITGEPPVEFIRSIKLDKATVLLRKTDLSIAEIAYSTGFSTPHYFTKSFKAKYNILPSEYRVRKIAIKDMAAAS
ncbi:hybrid sensor histidine kinase/response regulator transcription factor [Mucilaginibacter paludis]|nr:hybrid sensor histidine kinase/response regulator transcription factor [Mucilaginibacter paludis]